MPYEYLPTRNFTQMDFLPILLFPLVYFPIGYLPTRNFTQNNSLPYGYLLTRNFTQMDFLPILLYPLGHYSFNQLRSEALFRTHLKGRSVSIKVSKRTHGKPPWEEGISHLLWSLKKVMCLQHPAFLTTFKLQGLRKKL